LISQYADDTFLLLDGSELSLKETLKCFDKFHKVSGLKMNTSKTKVDINRCISFGRANVLITVTFPSNVSFLCCQLFNIFEISIIFSLKFKSGNSIGRVENDPFAILYYLFKSKLGKTIFFNLNGDWQDILLTNLKDYGGVRTFSFQKEKLIEVSSKVSNPFWKDIFNSLHFLLFFILSRKISSGLKVLKQSVKFSLICFFTCFGILDRSEWVA
jgi:hypothetical protein